MSEETLEHGEIGENTSPGGGQAGSQGGEGRDKPGGHAAYRGAGRAGPDPAPPDDAGGQRGGEDRPE